MSKYNKETLEKLEKSKLIRLLEKEGIEASIHQPKTELLRLLLLAKRANSPTAPLKTEKVSHKKKIILISSIIGALVFCFMLYSFNSTFQKNINFLASKIFSTTPVEETSFGPTIYERNGKTYVVYDYPLISVKAVYDPECKRPECVLDNFESQIKSYISPLINFSPVEYDSREGQRLIENYNLNLLPVFIFDTNIEKTENFENSKRNLEKVKDRYILQVPPTKVISGPQLNNARVYSKATATDNPITIVEYAGFSCKICFDAMNSVNTLMESLGDRATRYVKYFNTNEKDVYASVAAECAGQQNKFKEYYDLLFTRQDDWVNTGVNSLNVTLTNYAVGLGMNRASFSACLNNENVKQVVLAHFNEAGSLGISAAPTLVVNGNVLVGVYPEDSLSQTVNEIVDIANQ